jgi:hypothetical protein
MEMEPLTLLAQVGAGITTLVVVSGVDLLASRFPTRSTAWLKNA